MQHVTIYTTSWCRYCGAAKRLLDSKGVTYEEIDIETWDDPWGRLRATTGGRSVPQIVIGDTPVGGYDDLAALERRDRLDGVLAAAGDQPSA